MSCAWFSVHPHDPQPRAVAVLVGILRTGVVGLPSDAGYVLACRAGDKHSVLALRRLLLRRGERGELTLLCRDLRQLARIARIDDRQFSVLKQHVPGPHTFVLGGPLHLPRPCWPRHDTFTVQVPSHRVLRAVVARVDEPLAFAAALGADSAAQACAATDGCGLRLAAVLDAGVLERREAPVIDLSDEWGGAPHRTYGSAAAADGAGGRVADARQ